MGDKIWAVKIQGEDSWGTNNDSYETVSLHRTEDGAKKRASDLKLDMALYFLTHGECEDHTVGPDEILGIIESDDADLAKELKAETAKPGADFMKVMMKMAKRIDDSGEWEGGIRDVEIGTLAVED